MSLKRNILANYASQIYVTGVSVVMVPLYIKYMGAEAYGLVGFFSMLQVWFGLLDMGLTPTIARETARYKAGSLDTLSYRHLTQALERVFVAVALIGGGLLFLASGWIAEHWLNVEQIPNTEITQVIELIGVIVALRWLCGLYRGIISGSERLVWLSAFNTGIATLRFVLILPVLVFVSAKPLAFFSFQLIVAATEFAGLAVFAYRLLPKTPGAQCIHWEWAPLKPLLKFSLSIAFTSAVWGMVTQTDKLVLSKILPLADYGYFTLAVLVASGISLMSGPISGAIMPRMAHLQAKDQHDQLIAVYRQSTQLVMIVAVPIALGLAVFSEHVLWAWTGNFILVEKTAPILKLYAAGYGLLAVSAFPYYLQYAKGRLNLHIIGNLLFFFLLIPSVIWASTRYGMIGAGWAWLAANTFYFVLWVPLVHFNLVKGLHWTWLLRDVISIFMPTLACALLIYHFGAWGEGRLAVFAQLFIYFALLNAVALLSSQIARNIYHTHFGRL